jgi:acyl-CoA thioesterase-1
MRVFVSIFLLLLVATSTAAAERTILVVGDSLSAAYGIDRDRGWVALLRQRLASRGFDYRVVNASITGDTTRGGLSRLPAAIERDRPDILVLALGGNDGLRGFAPAQTRDNLAQMIDLGREAGASILLLGIRLPENYGRVFGEKFHRVFLDLAAQTQVASVPFFLEGVAETRDLMQADGIHPAAEAQPRILDNVWGELEALLIAD